MQDSPVVRSAALAVALDRLPDAVGILAADWTVLHVNAAGARLVGRRVELLVGRVLWTAVPHLAGTAVATALRRAAELDRPVRWRGSHAAGGGGLTVSAERVDGLLHVHARADAEPAPASSAAEDDRAHLQFLAEVSEAMLATLDADAAPQALARLVVPRLADCATVTVLGDDDTPSRTARAHRDPARLPDLDTYLTGRARAARDVPGVLAAVRAGKPLQVTDLRQRASSRAERTPAVRRAWQRLDARSCLFTPLRVRGETIGVLSLLTTGARPPHTEREIATAVEVARHGALALDNARLYSRQVRLGETLQRSLLTPPPERPGLQLAVRYRPASTHALVGGDFYDVVALDQDATLLVVGDVTGHAVEATAAMSELRSAVRTLAIDHPHSPARILSRTDRALTGLGLPPLATALVAHIETPSEAHTDQPAGDDAARTARRQSTLRWSSAGHPPPVLLTADGRVRLLATSPERLLGVDPTSARSDHSVHLHPGDTVVLYTDGLIEHGRLGINEGTVRLLRAVTALAGRPLEDLCDGLLERILTGRADDDVALLAVRCCA